MASSSPALATVHSALSLGNVNEAVRGLVPVTTWSYVAPGGNYGFLGFNHSHSCRQAYDVDFENSVRGTFAATAPHTMKEVEKMVQAILMNGGYSTARGLDKDSTTGLFLRHLSDCGSVYTPSLLLSATSQSFPGDSQAVIPESSFAPVQGDGSFELPAGTLCSKPGTPSPDLTPLFGPDSFAPALVTVESSSSARSFFAGISSGERKLYQPSAPGKPGFNLDRDSDDDWVPSAARAGPSRQRRARSHSSTKKTGPLVGVATRDRKKKQVVPASSLPAIRLSLRIPALALLSTIAATFDNGLPPFVSPSPMPPPPSFPPLLRTPLLLMSLSRLRLPGMSPWSWVVIGTRKRPV